MSHFHYHNGSGVDVVERRTKELVPGYQPATLAIVGAKTMLSSSSEQ
jgi:hypothetical protein